MIFAKFVRLLASVLIVSVPAALFGTWLDFDPTIPAGLLSVLVYALWNHRIEHRKLG